MDANGEGIAVELNKEQVAAAAEAAEAAADQLTNKRQSRRHAKTGGLGSNFIRFGRRFLKFPLFSLWCSGPFFYLQLQCCCVHLFIYLFSFYPTGRSSFGGRSQLARVVDAAASAAGDSFGRGSRASSGSGGSHQPSGSSSSSQQSSLRRKLMSNFIRFGRRAPDYNSSSNNNNNKTSAAAAAA